MGFVALVPVVAGDMGLDPDADPAECCLDRGRGLVWKRDVMSEGDWALFRASLV